MSFPCGGVLSLWRCPFPVLSCVLFLWGRPFPVAVSFPFPCGGVLSLWRCLFPFPVAESFPCGGVFSLSLWRSPFPVAVSFPCGGVLSPWRLDYVPLTLARRHSSHGEVCGRRPTEAEAQPFRLQARRQVPRATNGPYRLPAQLYAAATT